MKAVIMAGGEGTRLRPLSLGVPKPMTPLFGRPVMTHIINLLRHHGITDIGVTLRYLPQSVEDYFGDGSALGVSLTYFVERQPMGTAGGVKCAMDFLGDEDFLVISGDCVCDLDLTAAIATHRKRCAEATLLLYPHPRPLEYGLVMTDDQGAITRFVEKPAWSQVFTNTVNTGIYILSPRAMALVPQGVAYDFGKELFPQMLHRGAPLYGVVTQGYWCDMGDAQAYLTCTQDALSGKIALDKGLPQKGQGLWLGQTVPPGVKVTPPCWIGPQVALERGAVVGPYTVLSGNTLVGEEAVVEHTVAHSASIGRQATVFGAILCENATVASDATVHKGAVLGEGSVVQSGATVHEGVKLWPHRVAPQDGHLTVSLTGKGGGGPLEFDQYGVAHGVINETIAPETMLTLGSVLSEFGSVALGWAGGEGARMLSQSCGCGIVSAGGQVVCHDGETPAQSGWLAVEQELDMALFVVQHGDTVRLRCTDGEGLPPRREVLRRIESTMLRGEVERKSGTGLGRWLHATQVPKAYTTAVARRSPWTAVHGLTVTVPGQSSANRSLTASLEKMGCQVIKEERANVPLFTVGYDGLSLCARDEFGRWLTGQHTLALVCRIEMEHGTGTVAVHANAPGALEELVQRWNGQVLRLDRDGESARRCYGQLPWLRDGTFAGARICAKLSQSGLTLKGLVSQLPQFALQNRDVPIQGNRGAVMGALAQASGVVPQGDGLRLAVGSGWVYVVPLSRVEGLRVVAEGADMEIAKELCDFYAQKVVKLDEITKRKK